MALKVHPQIDRPLVVLGLEPEEWAILPASLAMLNLVFDSALPPIIGAVIMTVAVKRIKKGKPPGYLIHFLYQLGLPIRGWPRSGRGERRFSA